MVDSIPSDGRQCGMRIANPIANPTDEEIDNVECVTEMERLMIPLISQRVGYRACGSARVQKDVAEVPIKTQGEIESSICESICRLQLEYMGRGPKKIRAHLIDDLLVVRLLGVLTAPEQRMVKSLPAEKGRDLLKQVRIHLIETARPIMEAMVHEVTGVKVVSLHHDISTVTGEEVVLFTLAESPDYRQPRNDRSLSRVGSQAAADGQ
jgi:uncharacterized protein YbcI